MGAETVAHPGAADRVEGVETLPDGSKRGGLATAFGEPISSKIDYRDFKRGFLAKPFAVASRQPPDSAVASAMLTCPGEQCACSPRKEQRLSFIPNHRLDFSRLGPKVHSNALCPGRPSHLFSLYSVFKVRKTGLTLRGEFVPLSGNRRSCIPRTYRPSANAVVRDNESMSQCRLWTNIPGARHV